MTIELLDFVFTPTLGFVFSAIGGAIAATTAAAIAAPATAAAIGSVAVAAGSAAYAGVAQSDAAAQAKKAREDALKNVPKPVPPVATRPGGPSGAYGRESTLLTGPLGLTGNTVQKTLLGQ